MSSWHYRQVLRPRVGGLNALISIPGTIEYREMRFRHTLLTALQALATGMTVVGDSPFCWPRAPNIQFLPPVPSKTRHWAENRRGYR